MTGESLSPQISFFVRVYRDSNLLRSHMNHVDVSKDHLFRLNKLVLLVIQSPVGSHPTIGTHPTRRVL